MTATDIIYDHLAQTEPFDPTKMPDIATARHLAEWHQQCAAELPGSSSELASFHQRAAWYLRELHEYLRQVHSVLSEGE